jgi:hypothetical protein
MTIAPPHTSIKNNNKPQPQQQQQQMHHAKHQQHQILQIPKLGHRKFAI